jgi:hypothetical protein
MEKDVPPEQNPNATEAAAEVEVGREREAWLDINNAVREIGVRYRGRTKDRKYLVFERIEQAEEEQQAVTDIGEAIMQVLLSSPLPTIQAQVDGTIGIVVG